jgi:hypothetical protein
MADPGENNGQVWKEGTSEGQEGYGGTEARNLEERKVKEESHEPETGDRYRTFRGAPCGREGAQKESAFPEESVVQKENVREEKIRVPEEEVVQRVTTEHCYVFARYQATKQEAAMARARRETRAARGDEAVATGLRRARDLTGRAL